MQQRPKTDNRSLAKRATEIILKKMEEGKYQKRLSPTLSGPSFYSRKQLKDKIRELSR